MSGERVRTALRRKAEAGKPAADGPPMTPERALGQALVRAAQEKLTLPLQVSEMKESRMTLADLPEALEDLSLLAMIEGPGEALGLVALPPSLMSALIEVQTMGRMSANPPPARRPTRTDASMSAEFVDAFLQVVEESLANDEAISWAGGFRYASYLDDPRPLGLLLEDVSYRVYTLRLRLGLGTTREAGLLWAVPATGRGPGPLALPPPEAEAAEPADPGPGWSEQMEVSVSAAQVALDAVLHRVTLPLSAVLGMSIGTEIPLPSDALESLRIEGAGGRRICGARLGQARGLRAVRLVLEEESDDEAQPASMVEEPRISAPLRTTAPGFLADNSRNEARAFDSDLSQLQGLALAPEAELPPLRVGAF